MKHIIFSHDYPKLHGQYRAELLAVRPIEINRNTPDELLEYDTTYYDTFFEYGQTFHEKKRYPLKPGKYLRLIFDGDKGIPFTTIRKAYPPQKVEYYKQAVGETFEVWIVPEKKGGAA